MANPSDDKMATLQEFAKKWKLKLFKKESGQRTKKSFCFANRHIMRVKQNLEQMKAQRKLEEKAIAEAAEQRFQRHFSRHQEIVYFLNRSSNERKKKVNWKLKAIKNYSSGGNLSTGQKTIFSSRYHLLAIEMPAYKNCNVTVGKRWGKKKRSASTVGGKKILGNTNYIATRNHQFKNELMGKEKENNQAEQNANKTSQFLTKRLKSHFLKFLEEVSSHLCKSTSKSDVTIQKFKSTIKSALVELANMKLTLKSSKDS